MEKMICFKKKKKKKKVTTDDLTKNLEQHFHLKED